MNQQLSENLHQGLRVLDANANRAAEGLRTLEDYARLVREDLGVATWIKELRHRLATALATLPRAERLAARATYRDAGTELTTAEELQRTELATIIPAACERITQSLRNLEEYSKLVSAAASDAFKHLRYEAYDVLAQAELRLLTGQRLLPDQRLYVLVDCSLPLAAFQQSLTSLAEVGVDLFQLRDKRAEGSQLVRYARAAVNALGNTAAKLIVNDRVDVALASGAAGVHLGQEDLSLADARRLAGGRLLIGLSTHDIDQALAAEQGGADYIGCGPTFPSETKRFDSFSGTPFLKQASQQITIPIFAIGGITLDNVTEVMQAGCERVAVSAVIHQAVDPTAAARAMKEHLRNPSGS